MHDLPNLHSVNNTAQPTALATALRKALLEARALGFDPGALCERTVEHVADGDDAALRMPVSRLLKDVLAAVKC